MHEAELGGVAGNKSAGNKSCRKQQSFGRTNLAVCDINQYDSSGRSCQTRLILINVPRDFSAYDLN
jgi:hypothetical protein